jgi:acetyl esterase/lipase
MTGLVGLVIILLTVGWPPFRQSVSRLPVWVAYLPLSTAVLALLLGFAISTGQPWPLGTDLIENSLWLAFFPLGILFAEAAWIIAHIRSSDYKTGLAGGLIAILALALTLWPFVLLNFSIATMEKELQAGLGGNIPSNAKFRSTPFSLIDYFSESKQAPATYQFTKDVVYRTINNTSLNLDIYQPNSTEGLFPALVVVHGGGWVSGDKNEIAEFNQYMVARGWVVFALNYRLAPKATFPAPNEDIGCALAYIARNSEKYNVDIKRLALLGRSAGGTLALTAAYNPSGATECRNKPEIRAVLAYYPPLNLAEWQQMGGEPASYTESFLGGTFQQKPEEYRIASPIAYAGEKGPPVLLVQSGRDQFGLNKQPTEMAQKLRAAGNKVVLLDLAWAGHAFDLTFNGLSNQPVLYFIERFLAAIAN